MSYTVKQLAILADISVRTLHYYDEMGLLKPSFIEKNGYRHYEVKELLRLQQILFFRELEFPLEQIKEILDMPHFNSIEALNDHKKLIELKKKRLTKLLETITKTIKKMSDNKKIDDKELYDAFSKEEMEKYQKEAQERWGNTKEYKQSVERVKKMSKEEMKQVQKEGEDITREIGENMNEGIESPVVQQLIKKHHTHISRFYDCSYEMYRNLGKMYVDDPRFTAYYEKYQPGLAVFMRDAIAYYCEHSPKNK